METLSMALIIDIFDLALKEKSVEGEVPVGDMPELRAFLATDAGSVRYAIEGRGEREPVEKSTKTFADIVGNGR